MSVDNSPRYWLRYYIFAYITNTKVEMAVIFSVYSLCRYIYYCSCMKGDNKTASCDDKTCLKTKY